MNPSEPQPPQTAETMETALEEAPAPAGLLGWARSYLYVFSFFLTLLVFDPLQRIAILLSRHAHRRVVLELNRSLLSVTRILGTKIRVKRFAELDPRRSYIVVSNHQSLLDIPLLSAALPEHFPRFIAKRELAHWIPSVSFNLRHGGSALIDRSNAKQALEEIKSFGKQLRREAFAAVIFPEGTRARDGKLKKFRYAGLAGLLQAAPEVSIVPVAIDNSWPLSLSLKQAVPCNQNVTITIGAEIRREDHDSLKALADELHAVIENMLSQSSS